MACRTPWPAGRHGLQDAMLGGGAVVAQSYYHEDQIPFLEEEGGYSTVTFSIKFFLGQDHGKDLPMVRIILTIILTKPCVKSV
jgi:hypothetical protein